MYRIQDKSQREFEHFALPFGGHLDENNRWIELSRIIPWEEFEEKYAEKFDEETGAPAKSFRMAFGALLIKEKLGLTDRETVEQIRENPYLQYLLGIHGYTNEAPFDASMMVHFRKRITAEMISEINERIHEEKVKKNGTLIRKLKRKKRLR